MNAVVGNILDQLHSPCPSRSPSRGLPCGGNTHMHMQRAGRDDYIPDTPIQSPITIHRHHPHLFPRDHCFSIFISIAPPAGSYLPRSGINAPPRTHPRNIYLFVFDITVGWEAGGGDKVGGEGGRERREERRGSQEEGCVRGRLVGDCI